LLKPPTIEDNVDEAVGRKKRKDGAEFETDYDRAKRIRKERKAMKQKEADDTGKMQMNQQIAALLSKKEAKGSPAAAGPAGPVGPAGPPSATFMSFGPSVGVAAGPEVGVAAGPAAGPAVGPVSPVAEGTSMTAGSTGDADQEKLTAVEAAAAAPGPAPRPRGPMRPSPDQLPAVSQPEEAAPSATQRPTAKLGPMDYLNQQKRMSFDELKVKLAETSVREEGVPGSNQFDSYAEKLEKHRNERLKQQEDDTKQMLKTVNKGKGQKKDKKAKKDKKDKGVKRTADGAILGGSSDDSVSEEDCLLARYKKS